MVKTVELKVFLIKKIMAQFLY